MQTPRAAGPRDGGENLETVSGGSGESETEDLRAAQTRAIEHANQLEAVLGALPVGVAILDAEGGNIQANEEYSRIWAGVRPVSGIDEYVHYKAWWPDTGERVEPEEWASAQALRKGEGVTGQILEIERFDGTRAFVHNSAVPIRDAGGRIVGAAVAIKDITDFRRAEDELRITLESIGDGFFAVDGDWRVVFVSSAAERILGVRREDVLGRSHWEVFPLTIGTPLEREYRRAAAGETRDFENYYEPWDRWFHIRCFPREGGGMSAYFQDTTERKRAEKALKRGAQFAEALNRINEVLHSSLDMDDVIQRVVAEGAAVLGSETAAIALRDGDGWLVKHVHGMPATMIGTRTDDRQERHAVLAMESRRPVAVADAFNDERFDREHLRRHSIRSVLVAPLILRDQPFGVLFFNHHAEAHPFSEDEVSFARHLATTASIALENTWLFAKSTRAADALREVQERLALTASATRVGMFEWNRASGKIVWTDAHEAIFGYVPASELPTTTTVPTSTTEHDYAHWADRVHPDDLPRLERRILECLEDGRSFEEQYRIVWPDGSLHWVETRSVLVSDVAGGKSRMLGIVMDVTERKLDEERLRELSQRLTYHVDRSPVAVIEWGPDMRLIRWSGTAERLFGWTAEEVLGKRMEDFRWVYHEDRDEVAEISDELRTGQNPRRLSANRNYRKDGSVVECEWYNSSLVDEAGNLRSILSLVLDVTERNQAQDALRRANAELEQKVQERTAELAQRAAQLRAMAAELTLSEQRERQRMAKILHDHLQQLLVGAKYRLTVLARMGDDAVRQGADETGRLLEEAIGLSRSLTAELSPPILHEGGLEAGLRWLARWVRDKHGLVVDLAMEGEVIPETEDLKVLLFESVRELLFNTVKHARAHSATVAMRRLDGEIEVVVSDRGPGFDPEAILSGSDRGGFGLLSIRERLSLVGGRLEIDSAPGRGSRFRLIAPVGDAATIQPASQIAPEPPQGVRGERPVPAAAGRSIRVLLADDHAVMREGLAELLAGEPGIEVVGGATDGQEAVELAAELLPDVILMDLSMPRLSGIEATRALHAAYPDIRVIGLSMFDEAERAQAMRDAGAVDYLTKSGATDTLLAAIRRCVSR